MRVSWSVVESVKECAWQTVYCGLDVCNRYAAAQHLLAQPYPIFDVVIAAPSHSRQSRRSVRVHVVVHVVVLLQERAHAHGHAARRSSTSTHIDSFTDLGLHDKNISTRNESFSDHGFHDKHIEVEGFIWRVATKVACML
ncbi:hypothetical protein MSG28_013040 [Choristoneura fumiferana]|uniref:Uncharacterized protein n=1 Tax=Choristoneura fumiferana TaxID=7141 RepID=A0ACC0KS93_CHOFU|nr:hypothetical protein MSG28_013040 [Choristoneura fumiferana]